MIAVLIFILDRTLQHGILKRFFWRQLNKLDAVLSQKLFCLVSDFVYCIELCARVIKKTAASRG